MWGWWCSYGYGQGHHQDPGDSAAAAHQLTQRGHRHQVTVTHLGG